LRKSDAEDPKSERNPKAESREHDFYQTNPIRVPVAFYTPLRRKGWESYGNSPLHFTKRSHARGAPVQGFEFKGSMFPKLRNEPIGQIRWPKTRNPKEIGSPKDFRLRGFCGKYQTNPPDWIGEFMISDLRLSGTAVTDCRYSNFTKRTHFSLCVLRVFVVHPPNLRNEPNFDGENSMIETGTEAASLSFHRPEYLV
jgi:hypothetical protein